MPARPADDHLPPSSPRHRPGAAAVGALAGSLAAGLNHVPAVHAAGSDVVRIGLVGCGNRGTGACRETLLTAGPKRLVAVGDLFPERIEFSLKNLLKYDDINSSIDVPESRRFAGFDAYRRVIDAGVDLVLLATPPHFRPIHYAAAAAAGKHTFLEKPLCVDAPGYRQLLAANAEAKRRQLTVVVGLQRRHQQNYLEGIRRIRDGAVGDVTHIRSYFNVPAGGRAGLLRPEGMSEFEYQIRHWGVFLWLCGDHLVEQATHQIDVANWVMNGHPHSANGLGGRQVRRGPGNGDIWDHHSIEFEYEGGVRYYCQARQQAGSWSHVSETVHGTKGALVLGTGPWGFGQDVTPRELRDRTRVRENPYRVEHDNLFASIRGSGPYRLDAEYGADSSMTAVMGRMATYSGQMIAWEDAIKSELRLGPAHYAWDAEPPVTADADGAYPAAVPGVTRAW